MATLATELLVPRSAIILEERSLRTHDSARNSAAFLRSHGLRSAIMVTSPLHLLRAKLAFEATGIAVYPVRASEKDLFLVSSAPERISIFTDAVHEYAGLTLYRLWGWI